MSLSINSVLWQFSLSTFNTTIWVVCLLLAMVLGLRLRWGRLVALTAFLTLDLLAFGAFVRLTDSGLGCPDWPGCYGKFLPVQALSEINAAVVAQGGAHGPVNYSKAWIEMLHRYVASFIGALILVMLLRAIIENFRRPPRAVFAETQPVGVGWPLLLLVVVVLQGLFGKWTVTFKLMPIVVTSHLLGGMLLFGLLIWFWMRERDRAGDVWAATLPVRKGVRKVVWLAIALVLGQIFLGGWVSTNYAVLICPDFPTCNGSYTPELDWKNGFSLLRQLGVNSDGSFLYVDGLRTIHWGHRIGAVLTSIVVAWAAFKILRAHTQLRRNAIFIMTALLTQLLMGISTVVFNQPILIAVAHNFFAAVLLATLISAAYRVKNDS